MSEINTQGLDKTGEIASQQAQKTAGKAGKAAGEAAGKAAKKAAGAIAHLILTNPFTLAIIFIFVIVLIATNYFQFFLEGTIGFTDAAQYADTAQALTTEAVEEQVSLYYADDSNYQKALDYIREVVEDLMDEIQDDDTTRNSSYGSSGYIKDTLTVMNYNTGGTFTIESDDDIDAYVNSYSRDFVESYVISYILDYATNSQINKIEKGQTSVIGDLAKKLLKNNLEERSAWVCLTQDAPITYEDIINGRDTDGDGEDDQWDYEYHYYNSYYIVVYEGDGTAYSTDGIEWDRVQTVDDMETAIDLYTAHENGEDDSLQETLQEINGTN